MFEKVALRCLDMIEKQQNLKMERELARIRSELDSLRSEINDNVVSKSAKDISDVSKKALAAKNKKAKPNTLQAAEHTWFASNSRIPKNNQPHLILQYSNAASDSATAKMRYR